MQLRPYQQAAVDAVYNHLRDRDDNPCVVLPTGCHAKGHPILMADGSLLPVEYIKVGDEVMGPDSKPRHVLALCRGDDDLFEIIPHRGESFIVNSEHILSLCRTNESFEQRNSKNQPTIENVSVRDYVGKRVWWRHIRKLYRVPIDFHTNDLLPIPPYILGLLLGDGSIRDNVELTSIDEEVVKAWEQYTRACGLTLSVNIDDKCPTYTAVCSRGRDHLLTESLAALELAGCSSKTKFIPKIYLTASREERKQLLAGLIDTDGSTHRTGYEITTASKSLASDIVFLSRSLGFAANCRLKYSYCQTGAGGWYYRIHINGNMEDIPCRIARKMPTLRRQKKDVLRTGFTVKPCGRGAFYGFTLDGDHLYVDGHFMVHHNSGKTPCMATICKDAVTLWQGRVLVLAHVKELLQQTADKLTAVCPEVDFGIYSAGLKRRDTNNAVIIAGIQSIYKRACELDRFDLIIVDECHLIPSDAEGMYQQFLADAKKVNPHLRIIGFTATPFRLKDGEICAPENILNTICYEVGIKELIRDGFLCPLISKSGKEQIDFGSLHIRAGEFVADEVEALMDSESLVESVCREIVEYSADRNAVLIFSSGVRHGNHIVDTLRDKHGIECGFVTGETSSEDRDRLLSRFRSGQLKYLCNVNVLTTGFDAPNIDCVALVRPTTSPGLFYQAVGRGFRLHPSKQNCLILDFGGNVLRHGPVDCLRIKPAGSQSTGEAPAKQCPKCNALIAMGYASCPECGFTFPPPEKQNHEAQATQAPILSGQVTNTRYEVTDTHYYSHLKRGASDDAPRSMRVDYMIGWRNHKSEWVCFEHSGYARQRAVAWWKQRSPDPVPETTEEALARIEGGAVAQTLAIVVRSVSGEEYDRIVDYEIGLMPEPCDQHFSNEFTDEEIPF